MAKAPAAGTERRPRGIQSIGVGMSVLKVLIESRGPLHLREIAAAATMAPSNVYRYLVSFVNAGMVSQDPASARYDIGPLAIELGLAALRRVDAIEIGVEVLTRLVTSLEADGHLCVFGSAGPTVVRWKQGGPDVAVKVAEGLVLPLAASATGRVWSAFYAGDPLVKLQERELRRLADRDDAQVALDEALAGIRARGLSWSSGERRAGIDALCAPVFDRDGAMVVSLTLLGPTQGFDVGPDGRAAAELRAACEEISRALGCGAAELARYPWRSGG
jgi:DNA-binding IclR family transcriptional regulator